MRRLRSPSLYLTFAGAFLGVLVLGALLQAFAVWRVHHALIERLSGARATILVREIAGDIGDALGQTGGADIGAILDAYVSGPEAPIYLYRDAAGNVTVPARFPPRFGARLGRILSGEPPAPRRRPPRGPGPEPEPPEILARHDVVVGTNVTGEVLAVRFALQGRFAPRPLVGGASRFLVFLPLAILLAAVGGLAMFRILLGRIQELEKLAARIADGDLAVRVHDPGPDEIGRLGKALNLMTERLAVARSSVEASDRQRRRLFADISHELATPLTTIQGYTETLLDPAVQLSASERDTYLRNVVEASQRLGLLIEDLLELSRFEADAVALVKERLDWSALCRNTLQRFQPQFAEAGLRLDWEGGAETAWIQADGRRMEQVIDNLLVNALRYVPAGGRVTVSLTPGAAGRHRLTVADDGPGFPPEDLEHVFDRFYRGGRTGTANGSGLGLAIVREIVRSHAGDVRAGNRTPSGAVVEVELPAAG